MDTLTPQQRHYNMSRIKGSDTRPEKLVRSQLHRAGFRFRKNYRKLPGKPDIVLPKYHAVIFINGCFWHFHEKCSNVRIPKPTRNSGKTNSSGTGSGTKRKQSVCYPKAGGSALYGNVRLPAGTGH